MMKEGGITAYSYADINKQFDDIMEYLSINKH